MPYEDEIEESNEPIKVRCWIVEQREKAIKVSKLPPGKLTTSTKFEWLPKSLLKHISKEPPLNNGWIEAEITMPLWLAEDKELL